ncbi:chaperone protein dnaJ C76, chloroplastic-like [Rosa rugosa]|uniref:chaperone protein dnaJ C76, chloroplastic-like n=1 Tax=Rosa rugosa TaxID=74645 RepID=UPI002B416D49|nr:chaperone protein dnaJ C76, chloroplastic-like [Rosa rugosa]
MSVVAAVSISQFSVPKGFQVQHQFTTSKPILRQGCSGIRCCNKESGERANTIGKNYYELLGVAVDSNPQIIKQAYRNLQKKYHPDIAGQEGHEYTLKLNEAYKVLIRENLRKEYDASIGQRRVSVRGNSSTFDGSSWNGVLRPQALFVDENACIGCRQCVHQASATYMFDEALGCARVKLQYGDDDLKIEVSVDSCPVNCIHWVEREELPVLEFLIQPRPTEGHGIFGGGWERPANVFMAAKSFNKQLKEEAENENHHRNTSESVEEETPAQAKARAEASMKIKMEAFSKFWHWQK